MRSDSCFIGEMARRHLRRDGHRFTRRWVTPDVMAALAVAQEFKSRLAQSITQLLDEIRHAAAAGISMRSRPMATISTIMSCLSHDGSFNSIRSWTMPGNIPRNSSRLDAQALSPKRSLDSVHHTFASGSYATRTTISFSAITNLTQCQTNFTTPAGATP